MLDIRPRDLLARSAAAIGAFVWLWAALHAAATFVALLKGERELRAEALWLLSTACDAPRSVPMGGTLLRCDEARAAAARWPFLAAAEGAALTVLRALADGCRREAAAAMRALGLLGAFGAVAALAARAAAERAAAIRFARAAETSPMWLNQRSTVIPIEMYASAKED